MNPTSFRQFIRHNYQVPVQLTAPGENDPIQAITFNISQGGIFAGMPKPFSVGSDVFCDLDLDGRARTIRGRVAWTGEQSNRQGEVGIGMGIAFEQLSRFRP